MLQGFNAAEARSMVDELVQERMVTVRKNGVRKITLGCVMMCVPLVAWGVVTAAGLGIFRVRLVSFPVAIGLWGVWKVLNGAIALAVPKMESGDVAEQ